MQTRVEVGSKAFGHVSDPAIREALSGAVSAVIPPRLVPW